MRKSSVSISFKVLLGFLLLALFGGVTIWFIYNRAVELDTTEETRLSEQKRSLFTEVATRIYRAEGISRNIIQHKDASGLDEFQAALDTIDLVLGKLDRLYPQKDHRYDLDTISHLLRLKEDNLMDLLEFRALNSGENYYQRVLSRIEAKDYLEEDANYDQLINSLNPSQQQIIIGYLNYAEQDRLSSLADRTADSLISSVKQVLVSLEMKERRFRENLTERENRLLSNDLQLSDRLSAIRNRIEQDEIRASRDRVNRASKSIEQTSKGVIAFGVIGVLTILFFLIIIIRDVKESQRSKEALEEAKILAEKLLKSREQIMATVTHDLRSPLNSILGYSDLLGRTEVSSKQKTYLKQLQKSSDYTIRLVNDLLDFSRLESDKVVLENLPFAPADLLRECVVSVIPEPDPKNLEITVDTNPVLNGYFLTDPFRLRQILSNLIGNAYKFTEEGSIHIEALLLSLKGKSQLQIKISDTGIGISHEDQKKIFEAFSQADTDSEKRKKGFGLGLAISQKLTKLLGGTLMLTSELHKGSIFTVTVPVEKSEIKGLPLNTIELQIKDGHHLQLLVVDDDKIQLDLIGEIFENQGFSIVKAWNGKVALQKMKKTTVDAVFTDIQMPQMGGLELLKEIRKQKTYKDLPVIALSGGSQQPKSHYTNLGFSDYLLKPYRREELIELTARVLNLETERISKPKAKRKKEACDTYDLSDLRAFIGNDEESLKEILRSMVESTQESLKNLDAAFEASDRKGIAAMAHKMLPMLRQVKAEATIHSLEVLEQGNSDSDFSELKEYIDTTQTTVQEVLRKITENELNN